MRSWLNVFTPPEWSIWTLVQRIVYWALFFSGLFLVKTIVWFVLTAIIG